MRFRVWIGSHILLPCWLGFLFLLATGCGSHSQPPPQVSTEYSSVLPKLGFTVQVGAFQKIENALRCSEKLRRQGLEAYHFVHQSGLFKVRFGNYSSFVSARQYAVRLQQDGIIQEFYIVKPEEINVAANPMELEARVRRNIVRTAKRFIGVPYQWGGTSPHEGFDCSGLAMVAYQLNGLQLPRTSRAQYHAGQPTKKDQIKPGDLVFFNKQLGRRVSHVGIYAGNGSFIHAPREGEVITTTSLSNRYFRRRFVGARSYFQQ